MFWYSNGNLDNFLQPVYNISLKQFVVYWLMDSVLNDFSLKNICVQRVQSESGMSAK